MPTAAVVGTAQTQPRPSEVPSPLAAARGPGAAVDIEAALRAAVASDGALAAFYAGRSYRPLWIRDGIVGAEAERVLALLETADRDGLDPAAYQPQQVAAAIAGARAGQSEAIAAADVELSRQFATYVRDVRRLDGGEMRFVEARLVRAPPSARAVLEAVAAAPSILDYLDAIGWMNPVYAQLRRSLAARSGGGPAVPIASGPTLRLGSDDPRVTALRRRLGLSADGPFDDAVVDALREFQRARGLPEDGLAGPRTIAALNADSGPDDALLRVNLERARALPSDSAQRYLLVDAAAARLYLYEDGRVRDTMRVIVGKATEQTPMVAGLVRYAMVNPYWNVPPDLVSVRIAPNVLAGGVSYLRAKGYEVLSDWSDHAHVLDPATIDWKAVRDRRQDLRVRQLPGSDNAMGEVKFVFPNEYGVYLHDTPDKGLFLKTNRQLSSGCIRLEDAPRLAQWLFGKPLRSPSQAPEQRVDLPEPVPIYVTYLTVAPEGQGLAVRADVYGRDRARLAKLEAGTTGGR